MGISIQTNYANLVAKNTLQGTNNDLSKSLERLSTGFRINSAADDAAGLQIANRLEAQNRAMSVATKNAQNAISMMQTAEGALDEATNIAFRMNDLATQANNGTSSVADKMAMEAEFSALEDELVSIMENTTFGGEKLLAQDRGIFDVGTVNFQIGATSTETLDVDISGKINDFKFLVNTDPYINLGKLTDANSGTPGAISGTGPVHSMEQISKLIDGLGAARSSLGAYINRLEHTITNLGNMQENTAAAKSRIMDTDFASESGQLSKSQMLMQSGASMLSTTKMSSQIAMSLLS